ncbi:branched-chain amino acid ABC transporter permease [Fischerella thermalis CCMEE 5282]|jgi:neutral amino acid transport system permease protein|uniref:ABC-type transporter, integral membrane subunit n=1 Tax=Fischerella thermalis JSC-11 TaxID=741277 RepID=G6FSH1_9CYAN|nr:branched-chain amino acid ABC transporter permease [Fischerella thermalis]PMB09456.1 branched-chain amino acid ABC transporter permease [Fischerella thermalis CCMEE 5328]PMB43910.1 branched-chain amino acid ABC transporter permease [Fischerella thermalis CCMEE 5205]EHC14807.1 ABC-type transporter, integral membrane subunit [Fischerella thermalis JSC-11]PLZ62267.1 branched-chain amino acid ABC transporter permease [Fischerella thermalis WC344]PMB16029.1 branched-chain amino acid ABC transpor
MNAQLVQLVVNGISVGSIIALGAVGLTLTYGILRLSNFAHGDFLTLGAYLTLLVNSTGINIWLSMILAAVGTVAAMLLSEKLLWSRMRSIRATSTTFIIISIGLALFLRNGIIFFWGGSNQKYNVPVAPALDFWGIKIPQVKLLVIVLAILVILLLHYLLQNTKIGKAMRAVADDIDLARVSGINVDQVILWTWVIAGSLTSLGGSMLGLSEAVRPNMGWFLILPLFASVILGGIGNPYGAIAAAFIIGIVQEVSTPLLGSQYKQGVALLIMILVLLIRPKGLFKGTI